VSALPARRVQGPLALSGDARRVWNLARTLAATDWKVRFFGSALGYLWSLLRPLLLFGILYVVFSEIVGIGEGTVAYPIQLLAAMVLFFFVSEVSGGGLTSLVDREALVRKVGFPRVVVPLSVWLVALANLALNAVVLAVFVVLQDVEPRWSWLLVPIPVALTAVGALGLAMGLSALYVRFRDVRPIWEVVLQGAFYATPILYPAERLLEFSQVAATVLLMNPLAALVQETRHLLIGPGVPSAAETIGGELLLLVPLGLLVAVVVGGAWLFARTAPTAAEHL